MANTNKYLQSSGILRDWTHASRVVRSNAYALQPKYEHLFHVVFNFTPEAAQLFSTQEKMEFPLLVKDIDLPSYTIDTEEHNQYNRRVHSQHRINYTPVSITFHDDASERITKLWYAYYTWYYKDSTYSIDGSNYQTTDRYTDQIKTAWGMATGAPRFFKDIRVYSLQQKRFVEYTLINPMITDFRHGRHSYEGTGVMENAMTLNYETVKYATGTVNGETIKHFTDNLYYDPTPSPISTAEGRQVGIINGQIIDIAGDILVDLAEDGELSGSLDRLIDGVAGGLLTGNRTIDTVIRAARDAALNTRRSGDFGDFIPDAKEQLKRVARREGVNILKDVIRGAKRANTVTVTSDPGTISSNNSSVYDSRNALIETESNDPVPRGNAWVVPVRNAAKASGSRISDNRVVDRRNLEPVAKKKKRGELTRQLTVLKDRAELAALNGDLQAFERNKKSHDRIAGQFRNLFPEATARNSTILEISVTPDLRSTNSNL